LLSLVSTATALAVASASATAGHTPIRWEDLGVGPIALDLGFFALKWYSLA